MTSFLGNENVQKALRLVDRRLRAEEAKDLESVLGTAPGRRLYCRLVFELGNIEALSFNPDIKDGVCAAIHMAHNDGLRAMARIMYQEAQQVCPELWARAMGERLAKSASDALHREQALQKSVKEDES
jgi:hypothetical protein